jgi:hypothetical protein
VNVRISSIPGLAAAFIPTPFSDPDFVEIRRSPSTGRHRLRRLIPQILVAGFFLAIIITVVVTGVLFAKSDKKTQAKNELGSGQFPLLSLSLCVAKRLLLLALFSLHRSRYYGIEQQQK